MKRNVVPSARFPSLDIARGITILFMIEAHITVADRYLTPLSHLVATPFFLIIAGISFELFLSGRQRRGGDPHITFLETIWRAVLLFAITLILYLIGSAIFPAIFPIYGIFKWSIFQVIAVGYLLGLVTHGHKAARIVLIGLIFALYYAFVTWNLTAFDSVSQGLFPLVPGITYFLFGQVISDLFTGKKGPGTKISYQALAGTIILLIGGVSALAMRYPLRDYWWRDTLPVFLITTGAFLVGLTLLMKFVDGGQLLKSVLDPVRGLGRISFSAYYLHWPVYVIPAGLVLKLMPPLAGDLLILSVTAAALMCLERVWRAYDYRFGIEWLWREGANFMVNMTSRRTKRVAMTLKSYQTHVNQSGPGQMR